MRQVHPTLGKAAFVTAMLAALVGATAGQCEGVQKLVTYQLYQYNGPEKEACGCKRDTPGMFRGATEVTVSYGWDTTLTRVPGVTRTPWSREKVATPGKAFAAVLAAQATDPQAKLLAIIREGGPTGLVIGWCPGTGHVNCVAQLDK